MALLLHHNHIAFVFEESNKFDDCILTDYFAITLRVLPSE